MASMKKMFAINNTSTKSKIVIDESEEEDQEDDDIEEDEIDQEEDIDDEEQDQDEEDEEDDDEEQQIKKPSIKSKGKSVSNKKAIQFEDDEENEDEEDIEEEDEDIEEGEEIETSDSDINEDEVEQEIIDEEIKNMDEDEDEEKDKEQSDVEENNDSEIDDEEFFQELDNDEETIDDGEEAEEVNDDQDLVIEEGDESNVYEDKRKKPTKKKSSDRKLFPLLQKKKKKSVPLPRPVHEYTQDINVRKIGVDLLKNTYKNTKISNLISHDKLEQIIFTYTTSQNDNKEPENFNKEYMKNMSHCIGCLLTNNDCIITETKNNIFGWNSKLFENEKQIENREIDKIKNPALVTDNPEHPCPKCKCIRSFWSLKQLRRGDEGESKLFTCEQCAFRWRVNG
jgi:hypothetical protein